LLTQQQRDRISIVLVSPRNPLNIGAVARAMANFAFSQLTVVSPYEPHWREARSAIGAPELLANASEASTLSEAVRNCSFVLGTGTLKYRKAEQPVVRLNELAPLLDDHLRLGEQIALVLGPEKHGLTREDLSHCHVLVEIPTAPQQPSMNLGQAAAVCLYELATKAGQDIPVPDAAGEPRTPAPQSAQLDTLAALVEEVMSAAGYSPKNMQAANRHDLRLMLRRLHLDAADQRRILGLFRRILWRIKQNHRNVTF
jgi:TrmH family RNA methyltransferase